MTPGRSLSIGHSLIQKSVLTLSILYFVTGFSSYAQTNFSGTWVQDNVKSDENLRAFNVNCTITQDQRSITLKQVYTDSTGKEISTQVFTITPDGKEVTREEYGGINKEMAAWSADKKVLSTRSTRTVGSEIYGSTTTYTLSDNGRVLNILTTDIKEGGPSMLQVFNKKTDR